MQYRPQLFCDGFIFPETPRWHRGSFYCTSIDEGTIFRIDSEGSKEIVLKIDDWLSGWAFEHKDSDHIVLTSARKRKLLRWNGEKLEELADLGSIATWAINDLIRMPNGVTFVGSVNFEFGKINPSNAPKSPLIRVDAHGNVSVASNDVSFPNGMVIPPDGKRLIMADSLQANLQQWDLSDEGNLSNHRIFASIPGSMPDGISLDAEGGIWVTSGHRGVFRVVEGGEITDEFDLGGTGATACMLGGKDGRTLMITASDSHDRDIIHNNPSGRLFTVSVDVPGVGLPSLY